LGRKDTVLLFLIAATLFFFLAMPDVLITKGWTLEFGSCLLGSMAIASAYAVNYLYTSELAPTTHRGMVMSLSSSCARVGSFLGIYTNLLYDITDRRVVLALFAGLTMVYITAVFFLADTTGKRIPETPYDVEVLAGNEKYVALKGTDVEKNKLEKV
jgi:MFS family permease